MIRQLLGEREKGVGRGEVVLGLSSGWCAGGKVLREIRAPVFETDTQKRSRRNRLTCRSSLLNGARMFRFDSLLSDITCEETRHRETPFWTYGAEMGKQQGSHPL